MWHNEEINEWEATVTNIFEERGSPDLPLITPKEFAEQQRQSAIAAGVSEIELDLIKVREAQAIGGPAFLPERHLILAGITYAQMTREARQSAEV